MNLTQMYSIIFLSRMDFCSLKYSTTTSDRIRLLRFPLSHTLGILFNTSYFVLSIFIISPSKVHLILVTFTSNSPIETGQSFLFPPNPQSSWWHICRSAVVVGRPLIRPYGESSFASKSPVSRTSQDVFFRSLYPA